MTHFSNGCNEAAMTNLNDDSAQYLISTVSKRSGVKSDLVRAWERRYQAVTPTRTSGGHRVYTAQDIARLKLLNQATNNGHSISQIARLSLDELKQLVKSETSDVVPVTPPIASFVDRQYLTEDYIDKCYSAVLAFDANALEANFEHAIVELGTQVFIEQLLTPLLTKIGERWRIGELRPVHEHMASSIIRSLTYILRNNNPVPANAPRMIVTTPIGQLHELGALLAAIIAELKGWQVTYLGANLPAEEIAAAVRFTNAKAVTLSISFNNNDLVIPKEIRRLRALVGLEVALIVGGRAAEHYAGVLDEVGVLKIQSYDHFRAIIDGLAVTYREQMAHAMEASA
jgi:DNA-binding transcriptional MerR regulator/methylmalonyl-CoA mutase cobalamin-binding subunit